MDKESDEMKVKRIEAYFQPQAWQDDYAVNIDGACPVDVTRAVLNLPLKDIHALKDDGFDSDELVDLDALGHDGPFFVTVVDAVCDFFGVEALVDVTEEMLIAARREHAKSAAAPAAPSPALVLQAVAKLREARELLKRAGAPRAAGKVRSALKSAEGAVRHAECKATRQVVSA